MFEEVELAPAQFPGKIALVVMAAQAGGGRGADLVGPLQLPLSTCAFKASSSLRARSIVSSRIPRS